MSATLGLVCFITTLLLPTRRSFVSFQHCSPGQTLILLWEKEGRQAGSPGYILTLEGCIQFCFLHCCVFARVHKPEEIRLATGPFKGMLSRSKHLFDFFSFFVSIASYKNLCFFSYLDGVFVSFCNCHSTWTPPANIASLNAGFESRGAVLQALMPWWDEDEQSFGMNRDTRRRWRSMTSWAREVRLALAGAYPYAISLNATPPSAACKHGDWHRSRCITAGMFRICLGLFFQPDSWDWITLNRGVTLSFCSTYESFVALFSPKITQLVMPQHWWHLSQTDFGIWLDRAVTLRWWWGYSWLYTFPHDSSPILSCWGVFTPFGFAISDVTPDAWVSTKA